MRDLPYPWETNIYLSPPVMGADGNMYYLNVEYEWPAYSVELRQWITSWDGSAPAAMAVVASVTAGGDPEARPAQGWLVPGGNGTMALFQADASNSGTGVFRLQANGLVDFLPSEKLPVVSGSLYASMEESRVICLRSDGAVRLARQGDPV